MELSLVPDYLPNTARPGRQSTDSTPFLRASSWFWQVGKASKGHHPFQVLEEHPFLSMKGDGALANIFRDDSVLYVFDDAQLKSR